MNWRVLAALAVIVLTEFAQCQLLTGTCASIGYSTSCCPRGGNCYATDGNSCSCGDDCHIHGDCCSDVACPRTPRTCADVGIYQCCTDTSPGFCEVKDVLTGRGHYCSCNVSCHVRGDCCSDAEQIGCIVARQRCIADLPMLPMYEITGLVQEIIADEKYRMTLYFRCKNGYSQTEQFMAICSENGTWSLNPNSMDYNCSDINECLGESVCPEDSQCINTDGSYTCSCEEGYFYVSGETWNMCIDIDECVHGTHTCDDSERADCINNRGSYVCACKPGFVGDGESCQKIDGDTCSNICDQFCIQERVSPKCACDSGYYLHSDGVSCLDINECLITSYYNCGHADCINTNGSFLCVCHSGFISYGNSNNCTDINECSTGEHNCDQNADCINTVGGFECECRPSLFGDGIECLSGIKPVINRANIQVKPNHELQYNIGTDFCLEDPTSILHFTITCLLTRDPQPSPEFRWTLALNNTVSDLSSEDNIYGLSAYQENDTLTLIGSLIVGLDDSSTIYITCVVNNIYGIDSVSTSISLCGPTQCQDGVTNDCTQECARNETTGIHECSCRPGYEFVLGSKSVCEDIDECARNTHNCSLIDRQICRNTPSGSFSCHCGPGYSGNNREDIDECESDIFCPASSICMNTNGSFECVCVNGTQMNPEDHTGNCTDINECLERDHNCSQYAICRNVYGSYTCECVFGFEGNGVNCTISKHVIIGTGVAASLTAAAILLLLTITGCIKILKIKSSIPKKKREDHELDLITNGAAITRENEDSITVSTSTMKKVELYFGGSGYLRTT